MPRKGVGTIFLCSARKEGVSEMNLWTLQVNIPFGFTCLVISQWDGNLLGFFWWLI